MLTQGPSGDAPDAEAQLLVHALRAGRLTVLVGAVGVDKTMLLVSRVLPLLRRGVGELLHFVDQWNQAPLDSLLRALAALPAAAPVRFDLAEAMSPVHLSALSQRHGGARLLFVFDHFELLLQDAMHNAALQRFVDAWPEVVQAPGLNAHFLVVVDERAWLWLQALFANTTPEVELRAFRLETRSGRQALESLTVDQPGNGVAKDGTKSADFAVLLSESLARVSKVAREASLPQAPGPAAGSRQAAEAAGPVRDAHARRITEVAANAAQAQRNAEAARQAEAAGVVDAQRLAQALAAAEAMAAREVQARKVAEGAAEAAQAVRHAEAARSAEAARQAEAARRVEVQGLAQALAAAEATVAREVQARTVAEAAVNAARAEQRAQATPRLSAEAQQRAPEESVIAAAAMSLPEPRASDSTADLLGPAAAAAGPARTVLFLGAALLAAAVAAVLWWPTRPTAPAAPVASLPVATAPALPRTADLASAAAPALASTSASVPVAAAAEPAPAGGGRYEVLAAIADGPRARIARELAGALSSETNGMRVVPMADGTDPITWLRAPDRLAIARLDALRTAGGSAAPPLRVLTPLFSESVLFIVRADSPLKYFHQLRDKRLSIGPAAGPGSHTVRETYRRLFGAEMSKPAQFDTGQALGELVAFRSIDAVAIVEPRPLAWRASLDPKIAKRLRLLTLDPRHPADRKLLQTLGTQVTRIGAGSKKGMATTTPTVMSYLVVSGKGDADVDRLTTMARALCRELPRLRKQGDPIWRELQPSAQIDTGWPVVRPFQSTLSKCARR